MKLTPLDIRHKDFKRGMRGYVDSEVDEFLDLVADEFERIFKENVELSDRLETVQEQLNHYRGIEETLQKTLLSAQQTAEEVKASAQKESQLILRDADMRARDMVGEAERKARDIMNDAFAEKQAIDKEILVLQNTESDFRFKFRQLLEGFLKQLEALEAPARERAGTFAQRAEELKAAIAAERPPQEAKPAAAASEHAPAAPAVAPARQPQPAPAEPPRERPWWEPIPSGQTASTPPLGTAAADPATPPSEDEDTAAITGGAAPPSEGSSRPLVPEDDDLLADVNDSVGESDFKW
jgi:cell division initiation protein